MKQIIYPPTIDWNWMFQRPQQMMLGMSALGYKVYYFNITHKSRKPPDVLTSNVTIFHNQAFLKALPVERPILWISWPGHSDLVDFYHDRFVIFDAVDDFPQWRHMIPGMLEKADVVFTSSENLFSQYWPQHPRVYMIKNGADFEHFNVVSNKDLPIPYDMLGVPKPIIGYVGAIGDWVDADLLSYLARSGYSVVLVGPMFGGVVPNESNVHFLGLKDYKDLPAYISCFDVCVIPFLDNEVTRATNPIKMYEYLASGKPVVSTQIREAFLMSPAVRVAGSYDGFLKAVTDALSDSDTGRPDRIRIAKRNSWESRVRQADYIIRLFGGDK